MIFDTHLPTSIREVGEGGIVYTVKGSTKILRTIGDEYKSFQINDKVFERPNLTLKSGKKIKFMQPLAKGKIDMYLYIYRSSITMVNDVAKDIPSYYISYFLRKNSSKEESIANETMGTDKSVALLLDNEQVKGDYDYKQYGVLGEKEGVVKGLDLLKMVKDYNAAK